VIEQCTAGWEDEGGLSAGENVADMDAGSNLFPHLEQSLLHIYCHFQLKVDNG